MEKKKTLMVVGAAALMVLGVIVAVSATGGVKQGFPGKGFMRGGFERQMVLGNLTMLENLGLPANATREQVEDALWEKELKDLGLTDDSTVKEFREALKARNKDIRADWTQKMKDLGDSGNCTGKWMNGRGWRHSGNLTDGLEGKGSGGCGFRGMGLGKGLNK
jgi:hypothetical protein